MLILTGSLLGLLIGSVLGLTGAGGGIFAVPALVFGLGMSIRDAAPVALLAVGSAALLGALQGLRQGIVRYKAAALLAATGAFTAPLGVTLAHQFAAWCLNLIFVIIMLVVAGRMFISSIQSETAAEPATLKAKPCHVSDKTGRFVWGARIAITLGAIGAVTGLFTGLLGVGGGFIIVPALAYASNLRMHSIAATSLMVIALLSAVTFFSAWSQGVLLSGPTYAFALASLVGMAMGRLVAPNISSRMLQRFFSVICVVVALMMLMRNVG